MKLNPSIKNMSNEYIFFTDQTALTFRICLVYLLIMIDTLFLRPTLHYSTSLHFRDNISVPSSRRPIGCPETSGMNYRYRLRHIPSERRTHLLRTEDWNHATKFWARNFSSQEWERSRRRWRKNPGGWRHRLRRNHAVAHRFPMCRDFIFEFVSLVYTCTYTGGHTEGTSLCCDYFIWCVSGTVVVLTCF
jgi:hypothetical protein